MTLSRENKYVNFSLYLMLIARVGNAEAASMAPALPRKCPCKRMSRPDFHSLHITMVSVTTEGNIGRISYPIHDEGAIRGNFFPSSYFSTTSVLPMPVCYAKNIRALYVGKHCKKIIPISLVLRQWQCLLKLV